MKQSTAIYPIILTVLFPKFFTLQLKYADFPTNAVTYNDRDEKKERRRIKKLFLINFHFIS